ncbi:MAG: hypothetical protein PGN16_03810 [Sphingomonas phyllosphaerae]|uniref:hypothetical protein n=1 Tax=Sphingomonas phyllosphaerae TaxID=257003 RepID=UPI002FF66DE7
MPMHDDEYARIKPVIEMGQRLHISLQHQLVEKGVQPIDVLIAATWSAFHLAKAVHGSPTLAISWIRDTADVMERQLMEGQAAPD